MQNNYNGSPILRESVISWYEIPARPLKHYLEIEKTVLERDDNLFMSLSGITTKEESFFTVTESRDLSRTKEYCTRLKTIVTMSLNAKNVNRGVYTFWNVISDFGGLYGVLSVAGTIII